MFLLSGTNSHRLTNSDPSLYAAWLLVKIRDVSSPPETPSPRSRIDALLRSLYGETAGGQTAAQLADLIAGKRTEQSSPRKTSALSERDALLITYADQLREDGIAPLRTLASF